MSKVEEKYNVRMSWDEIVEKYPDKWVLLKDVIRPKNGDFVDTATLCNVYTDEESDDVSLELYDTKRRDYLFIRTVEENVILC